QESVNTILEMAEYKRTGRAQRLVVAGCLVERFGAQVREQIPEVDALVGTGDVARILEAIEGGLRELAPSPPEFLYHDLSPRVLTTLRHFAYIKINEGCDHPCSFCIIPELRGRFRSRRFESVIREAEQLASAGARELILIGQDTTAYGEDLGIRDGLPLLLGRLASIEELAWVRFLYCYPNRITPRLLETIARHPRLAKYLDVPLQHAGQRVLARMKRGGNAEGLLRLIERIRAVIPNVWLRTSFIAGFPGETEADFRELCDFVRAAEFDWLGVFAYSDDETAESHALSGKVDAETIADRRDRLMSLQRKISRRRLARRVGESFAAVLEGPSRESEFLWQARLEGMAPEIDGRVLINEIVAPGCELAALTRRMVRVEMTAAQDYDLVGRVIAVLDAPREALQPPPRAAAEPALRILA
ncbi:MAG TPA: 30S ribosomal protein S12 methylthiotransferase RimO, partial [Candidatus Acidoferrales bacterium]|nr:30S ribosomal protein S12 methylthiotransferase RimO [Candidatus Acidoferrales bacterium]